MKHIIFILFSILYFNISAQSFIKSQTENVSVEISSDQDLTNFLIQKFDFSQKNIELKQVYKVESLTGAHYTFQMLKNDAVLADLYLKAHVNKQGQLFFIQYNFDQSLKIDFLSNAMDLNRIIASIDKNNTIFKTEKLIVLNAENVFQEAYLIGLYNENEDFYVERSYFSETEYVEKNLKVYFAPQDTSIRAKVFMPDPLTSSVSEYGGDFQDAFRVDTAVLILKTIPNIGQSFIERDTTYFEFRGVGFMVENLAVMSNFTGTNIYIVFENIYLDMDGAILGYNLKYIDNITDFKTQIIIEDYDYVALNNERVEVVLPGNYSSFAFRLKNSFFEISELSPPVVTPYFSSNNQFYFTRAQKSFEEVNAFYHLNNFHSYLNNLGFVNLHVDLLKIDVHGANGGDNAFFTNAPTPRLVFGDGGVDDAEDADVVIHEYAHALSYYAAPLSNDGVERRALDEALGDYFASSYSAQFSDFNMYNVFSWDGHNEFWSGRITNSPKNYLDYNEGNSLYSNGEIWSATLMSIFNEIGQETTDKLILESLFYNVTNSKFSDAADILLLIDSVLFNQEYKCDIYNVLVSRKFKAGFCVGESVVENAGLITLNTDAFSTNTGLANIFIVEENFQSMDYWLSDAMGKQIFKIKNEVNPEIHINPYVLASGVYYLRIQTNNNKYKTKLLKR